MLRILIATFLLCLASHSVKAQGEAAPKADKPRSFDESFRDGLAAYQTKAYDKAQTLFNEALKAEPGNTAAMVNEGLASFQLDQKGLAIAWFRRALTVEPDNREARDALKFALSKLEVKEIPHRIEAYETLRSDVLEAANLRVFLSFTALLILAAGWLLFTWWGSYRRAVRRDEVAARFPFSTAVLIFLAACGIVLSLFKLSDSTLPRGTVLAKKIDARSAPSDTGVSLFQLYEGFEVLIREVKGDWVQVTYPGGLTGWIPKAQLLPNDGMGSAI